MWTTNIKPVREYLRKHDHYDSPGGLLLLLLPWAWLWRRVTGEKPRNSCNTGSRVAGRVACTTDDNISRATLHGLGSTATGHLHETPLAAVMEFLPLQQAFGEYCRKALCSEVGKFSKE